MVTTPAHLHSIIDHDGAVILDIPRNTITTLSPTGAYVWERLLQGLQVAAIISELAHDTGTDELVVAKDVEEFMEQLKSKHLVSLQ
jgi:hypothetical protein